MTSLRRKRVGVGQTARSSSLTLSRRVENRTTSPACSGSTSPLIGRAIIGESKEPPQRAQSASLSARPSRQAMAKESGRAMTAGALVSVPGARSTGRGWMRSQGEMLLLPPVDLSNYGPEQECNYYTASKACALGKVYSDASLIQPSWMSISRSPWGEAAKVCGGYGRRLVNGATSRDAPEFIYSKLFEGYRNDKSAKEGSRLFAYHAEANTAVSYDTPDFFRGIHTQVYGQPIEMIVKPAVRKILLGRQIMVEPQVPETDRLSPLEWDDDMMSFTGTKMV